VVVAGYPHPATERGTRRMEAFETTGDTCKRLRAHNRADRPCGPHAFIDRLEETLGRVLRPKPGGRPRNEGNP